ncbi:MAG: histidine phosphatase family protein [Verrucomicrobia bacterium]|nr:histidine phosphatase family protein [Verrucomicrobiota bacterium]MBV8276963.1 histidine phosphatase family protein [Verrucomicrobiota bacterium]
MDFDTFVYLRHGQSEANLRGLMCGRQCDSRLTELGREQARLAADILRRTCLVGSICVSPQNRAQETARIVNAVLSVPMVTIEQLAEWDVGSWDHQPFLSVRDDFLSDADPPGGETRPALVSRAKSALKLCAEVSQPTLIVSHGGVWMAVQQILELEPARSENAIPYRLQWKANHWDIKRLE